MVLLHYIRFCQWTFISSLFLLVLLKPGQIIEIVRRNHNKKDILEIFLSHITRFSAVTTDIVDISQYLMIYSKQGSFRKMGKWQRKCKKTTWFMWWFNCLIEDKLQFPYLKVQSRIITQICYWCSCAAC